jgi:hypothetical protein
VLLPSCSSANYFPPVLHSIPSLHTLPSAPPSTSISLLQPSAQPSTQLALNCAAISCLCMPQCNTCLGSPEARPLAGRHFIAVVCSMQAVTRSFASGMGGSKAGSRREKAATDRGGKTASRQRLGALVPRKTEGKGRKGREGSRYPTRRRIGCSRGERSRSYMVLVQVAAAIVHVHAHASRHP